MLGQWPCDLSLITLHISDCRQFSDIIISQGSVQTCIGCGGIVKFDFVANLPVSLPVKEFWKSVNIWGSYGQEFGVLFFWDTVYIWHSKTAKQLSDTDISGRFLQVGIIHVWRKYSCSIQQPTVWLWQLTFKFRLHKLQMPPVQIHACLQFWNEWTTTVIRP